MYAVTLTCVEQPLGVQPFDGPVVEQRRQRAVQLNAQPGRLRDGEREPFAHQEPIDGDEVARRPPRHVVGDRVRQDEGVVGVGADAFDPLLVRRRHRRRLEAAHGRVQAAVQRVVSGAQGAQYEAGVQRSVANGRVTEEVGRIADTYVVSGRRFAQQDGRLDDDERNREVDDLFSLFGDVKGSRGQIDFL